MCIIDLRLYFLSFNVIDDEDIKRWLSELRGKDMPESFAWSYKRFDFFLVFSLFNDQFNIRDLPKISRILIHLMLREMHSVIWNGVSNLMIDEGWCDSCRRYKAGYVWQDLLDEDLITPISDNEYVLKGSEISSITITNGNFHFPLLEFWLLFTI